MVILHARVAIKPAGRERWLALVDAVTPPSRAEDACHSYVGYEAIETPNTFIFVEEWTSLDGLYAHFHTSHFAEFFAGLGELLAEPPVGSVYEVASSQTLEQAFAAAGISG
ncbi:MAG: antibiotic biosynthesis monooxygenase [Solirubrobacterales bacterium]|nr:antibiotic biosynthesis monooxygenase [Solirubrobacterales bacterium]